jgi:hypothetical protein
MSIKLLHSCKIEVSSIYYRIIVVMFLMGHAFHMCMIFEALMLFELLLSCSARETAD